MSLRARVLIGAAVIAVVLAVGAVATVRTTRTHLYEQVDERLRAADAGELGSGGRHVPRPARGRFSEFYAGFVVGDEVEVTAEPDLRGDAAPRLDAPSVVGAAEEGRLITVPSSDPSSRFRLR